MTATEILRAAGWGPHPLGGYESRTLVYGLTPDGMTLHIKDWAKIPPGHELHSADTPDTAPEAAEWLVELYNTQQAAQQAAREALSLSLTLELDTVQGESDAAPAVEDRMEASVASDDHDAARFSGNEIVARAIDDADYEDIASPADPKALAPPDPEDDPLLDFDMRGRRRALGEDIKDFDPDPIQPVSEAVAIFGDNLPMARLLLIGMVTQIAHEKRAALQSGWTMDEYRFLQGMVVRMERGEAANDVALRSRFVAVANAARDMNAITAHADERVAALKAADRAAIEAYDPESGWPEFDVPHET